MERKKQIKKIMAESDFKVRIPKDGEVLGVVDVRLGFGKSQVRCMDGKTRICRVPGALKRSLWVRPGDVVLVRPWEYEGDRKGDILYNYKPHEVQWLKQHKYLKEFEEF